MDITTLFKACVKTIQTRNKAFGLSGDNKSQILDTPKRKNQFMDDARELLLSITRVRKMLLQHRKAYLSFARHLSDMPHMPDMERDKIDSAIPRLINSMSHLILDLKRGLANFDGSPQLLEHNQAVVESTESYLKTVCKIYSEQRAIRVKRDLEIKKISKLGPNTSPVNSLLSISRNDDKENEIMEGTSETGDSPRKVVCTNGDVDSFLSDDDQLTAEEIQMFELENAQMYNELNNLCEEVKQIESKVVRIAELQEVFTQKVLQQDSDIDRIMTTVMGSTENVKDANEQIRQAIQRNAGFRVWILFFLMVMSFSLLFLDWYND